MVAVVFGEDEVSGSTVLEPVFGVAGTPLDAGGLDEWMLGVSQPRWSVFAGPAADSPEPD